MVNKFLKKCKSYFSEVLHQAKHLPGSPFACDSYDPSKVVLQGVPKGSVLANNIAAFTGIKFFRFNFFSYLNIIF